MESLVGVEDDFQEREPPRRALSGDRVVARPPGAQRVQGAPYLQARPPPVVGVGLEGEPKQGDALALQVSWRQQRY